MSLTDDLRRGYTPGVAPEVPIPELTLPQMVEGAARRYPQRVALNFFSCSITYAQLVDRVRRAASMLAHVGVAPGDRVALMMPNCPQHIIAILATMTLGDIIVEHNPLSLVLEIRKEFEAHDARVTIVWEKSIDELIFLKDGATVFSVDLTRAMPGATQFPLCLSVKAAKEERTVLSARPPTWTRFWDHKVMQSPRRLNKRPVSPDDLALLIHTSSTTGIPKGAALTHRNILASIAQSIVWVPVLHGGAGVFYCVLPLFHTFGFMVGLFTGLHLSASVALFPKFDTVMILANRKRLPCTSFLGAPLMYKRLLKVAGTVDVDLSSVTFSLSGVTPLSRELAERWEGATGGLMVEGYGMTETSPIILGSPLSDSHRLSTSGIPFPSTQIQIVDPGGPGVDVPEGEIDELIVKGPQVSSDYWERPEETAEALWNGWLRTGDLMRIQSGFIHMADHHKEMINASDSNVYPSQVENAVRDMPGVRDITVIGLPTRNADESVVAAVILEASTSITLTDVCQWAEKSIARYAFLRQTVVMTGLPHPQLGRVMHKKVREQILDAADSVLTTAGQVRGAADQMRSTADQVRSAADSAVTSAAARLRSLKNREWVKMLNSGRTPAQGFPDDRAGA